MLHGSLFISFTLRGSSTGGAPYAAELLGRVVSDTVSCRLDAPVDAPGVVLLFPVLLEQDASKSTMTQVKHSDRLVRILQFLVEELLGDFFIFILVYLSNFMHLVSGVHPRVFSTPYVDRRRQ